MVGATSFCYNDSIVSSGYAVFFNPIILSAKKIILRTDIIYVSRFLLLIMVTDLPPPFYYSLHLEFLFWNRNSKAFGI